MPNHSEGTSTSVEDGLAQMKTKLKMITLLRKIRKRLINKDNFSNPEGIQYE